MDYAKHYAALIDRARNRAIDEYYERHHVIPRCMGGSDDENNIALLSGPEHYMAHKILAKMYPGNRKLQYALITMLGRSGQRHVGSENKRYGQEAKRIACVIRADWRRSRWVKGLHRPKKKRFKKARVEALAKNLAPKTFFS